MRRTTMLTLLSVSVFLAGSRAVSAQTDHGALVSGQAAAAVTGWTTAPAISAFIGYRFNRAIGIGVEITSAPSLEPDFERDLPRIALPFGYDEPEGALTVFTTNVRVEIPTLSRRVVPYVVGGGGLSNYRQEFSFYYPRALPASSVSVTNLSTTDPTLARALEGLGLSILPIPQQTSSSTVSMALTLGGGASILLTDHLAIDIEGRAISLLGGLGTIGRFGVGMSYRF